MLKFICEIKQYYNFKNICCHFNNFMIEVIHRFYCGEVLMGQQKIFVNVYMIN